MRIIAGRYRSRRLKVGPPTGTRPTSDKLRETLFNILGRRVIESRFLDAYAGVGAVGIEAFSRGASTVSFVDASVGACAAIRKNLEALDLKDEFPVLQMDLARALKQVVKTPFDIAFLDPPYDSGNLYRRDLELFGAGSVLDRDGIVVIEHARSMELPAGHGCLRLVRTYSQRDSALTFYEQESR